MSRRLFQIINGALALLTIVLAGASLALGTSSPIYGSSEMPLNPSLDSNLRFMGGMGLGLGLCLLWTLPSIERRGTVFRVVWLCALLGGVGRLISFAAVGSPPVPLVVFTVIEVPGVPLLIWWQYRIEKAWHANQVLAEHDR
jgi:hypothetical protein